jgi:hypothetical protein
VTKEVTYFHSENYEIVFAKRGAFPVFHPRGEEYDDGFVGTRIRVSPDRAAALKETIRALIVCKLAAPYSSEGLSETKATIDNPTRMSIDRYYLHVQPLAVWFYDWQTGQIIAKVRSVRN